MQLYEQWRYHRIDMQTVDPKVNVKRDAERQGNGIGVQRMGR